MTDRPLTGTVVLDLTSALAGPYATLLLAALGATVIKIENPSAGGDASRRNAPYFGADGLSRHKTVESDMSVSMLVRGRGKLSMSLDLKHPAGRAVFLDLARQADVVVENYAAGTADRLGVGYEAVRALNPGIVYTSISGFGATSGQRGSAKAMDSIIQALSGVMMTAGEPDDPPVRFGLPIGDLLAPLFAVIGTVSALLLRARTGQGQQVDVSMLGALTSLTACEPFDAFEILGLPMRTGQMVPRLAPFGMFEAVDGWVALCAPTDRFAHGVFAAMGRPELADDQRFITRDHRVEHAGELHGMIGDWFRTQKRADAIDALTEAGVPAAEVRDPAAAVQDPDVLMRGDVVPLRHPEHGDTGLVGPGLPITFSGISVELERPAPQLGQHTQHVLTELLRYDPARISELTELGVL